MYMANTKVLRMVPNVTYIPLTCVGGFALGNVKNLRHPTQEISTCWYIFALDNAKVLSFALGDAKVPNKNGFASQWNIGYSLHIKGSRWIPTIYGVFLLELKLSLR